ncbi:unnamed protein product [Linum tenue]|uniref:Uncharacterized protein n=1 Tax=Linum tenue TaxID=586396 RepID=A0AAV0PUT9_9ROSI|nr:unnamed protein product [Linum tenue]
MYSLNLFYFPPKPVYDFEAPIDPTAQLRYRRLRVSHLILSSPPLLPSQTFSSPFHLPLIPPYPGASMAENASGGGGGNQGFAVLTKKRAEGRDESDRKLNPTNNHLFCTETAGGIPGLLLTLAGIGARRNVDIPILKFKELQHKTYILVPSVVSSPGILVTSAPK